jgi:hypothetical protein
MILLDFSSIAMSSIMPQIDKFEENTDMIRHIMINIIRRYNEEYRDDFGEMVICMDAGNNWRKQVFPQYKANRRKNRDNSIHDWNAIFTMMNQVRDDIRELSPFRCVWVDECEADDAIGTIVEKQNNPEPILIVSPDGDFKQLQRYPNVKQWSNLQKKWVISEDPVEELHVKVCKGDTGDGVPNCLSDDDVLITEGTRQTPLSKKKIAALKEDPNSLGASTAKRLARNTTMIDLTRTPDRLKDAIMSEFDKGPKGNMMSWMNYLMKNQLKLLLESASDFEVRTLQ